jgi:hypothetical protein
MNTVWDWWNKNIISKYGPSSPDYFYDNPPAKTVVNCLQPSCLCNAYYSPPNFLFFGDQNSCAEGSEDLVIDSDVVRHEYTHAVMDWVGFDSQFSGPVNYYGRAMGEGNADWFGYLLHTKESRMATVAFNWRANGYLRNLDSTRMYPRDVDCPTCNPPNMPEEHYTGEIWGGYLYDLYRVLGKNALKYIYNSFYYFDPAGGWMASYPDFFDAINAQANAEYDLTGKSTQTFKGWGSMVSRGILGLRRPFYCADPYFGTGAYGCDAGVDLGWILSSSLKTIKTKGNLLLTGDPHDYLFAISGSGWDLTVTVTGTTNGIISPSISLYTIGGSLLASGVTVGNKATLKRLDVPPDNYIIRVTGTATAPARGYYNFQVKIN